ncbi:MAG: LLM class F420-dependent oxidoreductase [Acidimicrobiia bacterium]|nr:LLM class F420-dependent oxidoreductase [Acidimicrobiia bacterium]
MARLGLTLPLVPRGAPESVAFAREAFDLGYEEIWTAEVGGLDSYALAAAAACTIPGVRIGTAVVPAQTRTPMVHAMAATTLSQLTHGNFVLGLGISSENIVADWAGQPFDRPLARMREIVTVLREVLSGEKVTFEGSTLAMRRFRLQSRPQGEVPIFMAALNRGMLRLAGEIADGVILNMVPERALPQVLGEVRAGAEAAGRDPGSLEVVARLHVVLTDDAARDRDIVRMGFGAYAATSVYNRFFRWIGFEAEAEAVAAAFAAGDRAAVAGAMSDDMCDAIAICGDEEHVAGRVEAYAAAGIDVCVLNPLLPESAGQRRLLESMAGVLDGTPEGSGGVVRGTA